MTLTYLHIYIYVTLLHYGMTNDAAMRTKSHMFFLDYYSSLIDKDIDIDLVITVSSTGFMSSVVQCVDV